MKRLTATVLAILVSTGVALAQQSSDAQRCSETLKSLDRELFALSQRLSDEQKTQTVSPALPATQVLAELVAMDTLREHLRCLGLQPQDTD